ncbi:hypothetical protein Pla144_28280 [Bythopirellula polymerisocia]|uniref:Uncharacterized protein n=1 Tax=Bythopirellula polymerisocia TaxID=2528003 RepID=A0A5C6CM22_9BACT|nr:hypothetical protein Pla144_28280 [Bythopirellula polymerisocia]
MRRFIQFFDSVSSSLPVLLLFAIMLVFASGKNLYGLLVLLICLGVIIGHCPRLFRSDRTVWRPQNVLRVSAIILILAPVSLFSPFDVFFRHGDELSLAVLPVAGGLSNIETLKSQGKQPLEDFIPILSSHSLPMFSKTKYGLVLVVPW